MPIYEITLCDNPEDNNYLEKENKKTGIHAEDCL
jgi:hypothetical protein